MPKKTKITDVFRGSVEEITGPSNSVVGGKKPREFAKTVQQEAARAAQATEKQKSTDFLNALLSPISKKYLSENDLSENDLSRIIKNLGQIDETVKDLSSLIKFIQDLYGNIKAENVLAQITLSKLLSDLSKSHLEKKQVEEILHKSSPKKQKKIKKDINHKNKLPKISLFGTYALQIEGKPKQEFPTKKALLEELQKSTLLISKKALTTALREEIKSATQESTMPLRVLFSDKKSGTEVKILFQPTFATKDQNGKLYFALQSVVKVTSIKSRLTIQKRYIEAKNNDNAPFTVGDLTLTPL